MLNRRTMIAAALMLGAGRSGQAGEPLQVFSADVRPLSIAEGDRHGIVLDVVQDAARAIGREVRFTFLPFAEAMRKTLDTPGALMAPLARSAQREADFAWISKVIDVPQAMGTMAGKPVVGLDGGRQLARVAVVRGGIQESFLKDRDFSNLVLFATARDIAPALASGEVDAWYGTATEIALNFELLGQAGQVRLGPTLQAAPVWLAANRNLSGVPVSALAGAVAELARSGAIDQRYRSYVPN